MASNPAEGVNLKGGRKVRLRQKGFTAAEASAILRHASDYRQAPREKPKAAASKRWVPWLCAYTGARVGEMVQLRKQDVRRDGEVWIITITPAHRKLAEKLRRRGPW